MIHYFRALYALADLGVIDPEDIVLKPKRDARMSPEQWDAWWDEQMYEFRLYLDALNKKYAPQNPVDALLADMQIKVRDRNG